MLRGWTVALIVVGLAGCGEEATTAGAEPGTAGAEAPEPSGPPKPWEMMNFEERKAYMKDQVLPTMEAHFQAFDAEHYADFTCASCHGGDAEERNFEMPSPDLPALPSPQTSEWEEMVEEPSGVVAFMMNEVVPTMSEMLGEPQYNPETGEGFGCFECHTMSAPEGGEPGSGLGPAEPDPAIDSDFPGE